MTAINKYDYFCPKCDHILSKNNQVIFTIKRSNDEKVRLYLDPKPGSYNYKCEPETQFDSGEEVEFYCPHCNQNLQSEKYSKFVQITLKVTKKVVFDVFFSRIHGDHSTYVGIEDFEEEYGHKISQH